MEGGTSVWGSSSPSQTSTIAEAMEPAEAVLVRTRSFPKPKTYAERSKLPEVPISTFSHHEHGRLSRKDAAAKRQYLTPSEEKAFVDYILGAAESDHPVLVMSVGQLAWTIARRRSSTFEILADDDSIRPPGKNWVQKFYKRHPDLKSRTLKPLDWARHDIYEKVTHWFTLMDRVLHDPAILAENVYNMDETGNLLSNLTSRKYVLHAVDRRRYRGATIKRQLVTTIECIPAEGKPLSPLVVWPAATQRSDWTTHSTPGWHYACSPRAIPIPPLSLTSTGKYLILRPNSALMAGHGSWLTMDSAPTNVWKFSNFVETTISFSVSFHLTHRTSCNHVTS